ncbi:Rhodopirellula transposase family protein [mine drainage metagenome]|uniref:Rhodopirellula transposase family protein n=4 Tax=mine drainage metagenome TaxID=410659 RepID=T0ZEC0_9ZZZZ
MPNQSSLRQIKTRYGALGPLMDERMRRQWAATEAQTCGWGGLSAVSAATGLSRNTIRKGLAEIAARKKNPRAKVTSRVRTTGGGRKRLTESDPGLTQALERLVDPMTRGDPMSPLRWTCKSTSSLAEALTLQEHPISAWSVGALLKAAGYSLQSNRKTKEGSSHPDRNAQFEYINAAVRRFQQSGQPVISVDTKKKEAVGPFKNGGREWQPRGAPEEVDVHDFPDPQLGKVVPYGVFDLSQNEGWVSVGIGHDTAQFAVQAIGRWWQKMGRKRYPHAQKLLITADGGGSNGSRCRLWKVALQELATHGGIPIHVCHFPPGTSKWNQIEHRMFCHITQNWRGRPLVSHEVIINLIANTTTQAGLKIRAELDRAHYPVGIKVTDAELSALNLKLGPFHGDWNYALFPVLKRK